MDEQTSKPLSVRLPSDIKERVVQLSEKERRSLNSQLIVIVEAGLRAIESSTDTKQGERG